MARPRKYFFLPLGSIDSRTDDLRIGDTVRTIERQDTYPFVYGLWIVNKIHPRKGGVTVTKVAA